MTLPRESATYEHGPLGLEIPQPDGSALIVNGDLEVQRISAKGMQQLACWNEVHTERFKRSLAHRDAHRAIKEARITRARRMLAPAAFEAWRRRRYPTIYETLKDVWSSDKLQEQMMETNPFLGAYIGKEAP